MATIEELEARVLDLEEVIALLQERGNNNEAIAISIIRALFAQGLLPLSPDLKTLLIENNPEG